MLSKYFRKIAQNNDVDSYRCISSGNTEDHASEHPFWPVGRSFRSTTIRSLPCSLPSWQLLLTPMNQHLSPMALLGSHIQQVLVWPRGHKGATVHHSSSFWVFGDALFWLVGRSLPMLMIVLMCCSGWIAASLIILRWLCLCIPLFGCFALRVGQSRSLRQQMRHRRTSRWTAS